MNEYLTEYLQVPKDHIDLYLSSRSNTAPPVEFSAPSHVNIISTLRGLMDRPEIKHGDNIVVYYSGHGASYHCLRKQDENSSCLETRACDTKFCPIEALCPMDCGCAIGNSRSVVSDISDRELNTILTQICLKKGHRIMVILDCCYASGGTRKPVALGVCSSPPIKRISFKDMLDAVHKAWKRFPGYLSLWAEDWQPDLACHVLLAACREYEFAREMDSDTGYNSLFTKSLINALTSNSLMAQTTYKDLIEMLPHIAYQSPLVVGEHKNKPIWFYGQL